jgi:Family of unknown function (DUF6459)
MTAPATETDPGPDPAPAAGTAPTLERPRLRLVAVRTPQPPLQEDGRPVRLAYPGVPVPRLPHRPGPRPRSHTRPLQDEFGPTWSVRAELPDPRAAGRQVVTVALEALAGRRPLAQLRPLTSAGVFAALTGGRRPPWCGTTGSPLLVGRVHVCEPVDGVAEVSAVAHRDGRAHAVAARLEGIDGRWRCTALQVG